MAKEASEVSAHRSRGSLRRTAEELRSTMYDGATRRVFNSLGVHVIPANFYSVVPSFDEIDESFEYAGGDPPYDDPSVFDLGTLDATLEALMPFAAEFDPPTEGDRETPGGFFWANPAFSFSDAMSYYAFLRLWKPQTVVEVGSGFSTLVASEAVRANGFGRILCVEPFPKSWLADVPGVDQVFETPVQSLDASWFNERLSDGDVFFIDSTHTVKTGSDCAHLYLRVLPALTSRLLIHAHDIFLPHGYPRNWLEERAIYWNEQYVLYALLLGNPRLRVLFGSSYLRHHRPEALDAVMHGRAEAGGGSLWFERGGHVSEAAATEAASER